MRTLDAQPAACPAQDEATDVVLLCALKALQGAWSDHEARWTASDHAGRDPYSDPDVEGARRRLAAAGLCFAQTPARTISGLVLKLRHVVEDIETGTPEWFHELLAGTLADAERMAAETAGPMHSSP